jgi:hypothetical protein
MKALEQDSASTYERVFIADQPDSPTWPYDIEQTEAIGRWGNWSFVGPLYRSPTDPEIQDVRRRYGWSPRSRLCVFSLGGGGEHAGADDATAFLAEAELVAHRILSLDSEAQMIMVRGPLMSGTRQISSTFRVVDAEPLMPALFAVADLACIRPGFNSTWECIHGATPILPILGTSHEEPVQERLVRLRQFGLLATDVERAWRREIVGNRNPLLGLKHSWSGDDVSVIRGAIIEQARSAAAISNPVPQASKEVALANRSRRILSFDRRSRDRMKGKALFIRIDDVTALDGALRSLLSVLHQFNAHASLQVIPYLCDFDAYSLQAASYSKADVSIGQHGYCHVSPRWSNRGEFCPHEAVPSELYGLLKAKQSLEQRFGEYFDRGMSPPFDEIPAWLGEAWEQMGGHYISVIRNLPRSGRVPFVSACVDVWHWRGSRRASWSSIGRDLVSSCVRLGYAGIVLHPQHFRATPDLHWLEHLLDQLQESGVEMVKMSAVAQFQSMHTLSTSTRHYAALGRAKGGFS